MPSRTIFITGATGYMGRALSSALLSRGHRVRALAREASRDKVVAGATAVAGDALQAATFADQIAPADTLVHLIGTPNPSPAKAASFRAVDLPSVQAAIDAARLAGVRHFLYVSVAHPAPIMRSYIDVRLQGEKIIRDSAIPATILRPWYVLGPGHRWPYLLLPAYALLSIFPATRDGAERLGLVSLKQMIAAMVLSVESPADDFKVLAVPDIRAARI